MARYSTVNAAWPEGTNEGRDLKPTPEEAVRAVRTLYRVFAKRKITVKATSGRRRGGWRGGVLYVNPDRWGGGWHEIVHMVSHRVAWRLHPGKPAHDGRHAFIEKEMIAYVVSHGWLEGKLRPKEKPPVDRRAVVLARTRAAIKRWTTKKKRAETALRKLGRKLARQERALVA